MRYYISILVLIFFTKNMWSQDIKDSTNPYSKYTKAYIDSLIENNDTLKKEFEAFLKDFEGKKSYFDIGLTGGNNIFSANINTINASQTTQSIFGLTPSLGYYHQSGLSLYASAYYVLDNTTGGKNGFYQYTLVPAYEFNNSDVITFGASYTHYFREKNAQAYASPFENEWFGYVHSKKGIIQPGLALGYATGNYNEYTKRQLTLKIDTTVVNLKGFFLIPYIQHQFEWEGVLSNKDALQFLPSFLLNFGSSKSKVISTTLPLFRQLARNNKLSSNQSFRLQSAALSLNLEYQINNFYFQPSIYFDYYVPNNLTTGEKRLSTIFSFMVGKAF